MNINEALSRIRFLEEELTSRTERGLYWCDKAAVENARADMLYETLEHAYKYAYNHRGGYVANDETMAEWLGLTDEELVSLSPLKNI